MRVFLCEFVTAGGLRGEPLPASLAREGRMMRDAMLADLREVLGLSVATTVDDRLAAPEGVDARPVGAGDDPWTLWRALAAEADVAWIVAPETDGALFCLATLCEDAGARVLGPTPSAIALTTSKRETARRLADARIATPETYPLGALPKGLAGPFVSKPDDGAGCDDTRLWEQRPAALPGDHVIQPYVHGVAASLTALGAGGGARLLAGNRQHITLSEGLFGFEGLAVGALDDEDGSLAELADAVARAIPGLDGLFGIDVVLTDDGPVVIEVNPRVTTAYAGLRRALGVNPLRLLPPFADGSVAMPERASLVEVRP